MFLREHAEFIHFNSQTLTRSFRDLFAIIFPLTLDHLHWKMYFHHSYFIMLNSMFVQVSELDNSIFSTFFFYLPILFFFPTSCHYNIKNNVSTLPLQQHFTKKRTRWKKKKNKKPHLLFQRTHIYCFLGYYPFRWQAFSVPLAVMPLL